MRETCRACDGAGQIPDTRDPFERNAPRIECQACGGIGETAARILDCGHGPTPGAKPGTGYAYTSEGRTLCYACSDEHERQAMSDATGRFLAYVSSDGKSLTTWPGGILARVTGHSVSRTGWHGSKVHRWWAVSPDGAQWYGSNAGEGMCIGVRRIKGTR